MNSKNGLKLNLGCGQNLLTGYINVDKFGNPDTKHDLEIFPWPWQENSVNEIVMNHILEHLGKTTDIFLKIIQEIYRICCPNALIKLRVPHPRHDDFIGDPTHVRAITPSVMSLFSKENCRKWSQINAANTPLALFLDVDFKIVKSEIVLEEPWASELKSGRKKTEEIMNELKLYNNVAKEFNIHLQVIKSV